MKLQTLFLTTFLLLSASIATAQNQEAVKWLNLGNQQIQRKDFSNAVNSFGKCLELVPTAETCYFGRGIANFQTGKFEAAVKDFSQVIFYNRNYFPAYQSRAVANCHLGKLAEATKDEAVLTANRIPLNGGTCADFLAKNPQIAQQGKFDNSDIELLKKARESEKELIKLLVSTKGKDEKNPANKELFEKLRKVSGETYMLYRDAVEKNPRKATAYVERGRYNARTCFYDAAMNDFKAAESLQPADKSIYLERAVANSYVLEKMSVKYTGLSEKFENAIIEDLKKAGRTDVLQNLNPQYLRKLRADNGFGGENPCIEDREKLFEKGYALYSQKNYKEALKIFDEIKKERYGSSLRYNVPVVYLYSGLANKNTGNYKAAIEDFKLADNFETPNMLDTTPSDSQFNQPTNFNKSEIYPADHPYMVARLEIGKAYLADKNYSKAAVEIGNYYRLLETSFQKPKKPRSKNSLGLFMTAEEKKEEAELKKINGVKAIPILKLLAEAYCLDGKKGAAKSTEEKILEFGGKVENPCK